MLLWNVRKVLTPHSADVNDGTCSPLRLFNKPEPESQYGYVLLMLIEEQRMQQCSESRLSVNYIETKGREKREDLRASFETIIGLNHSLKLRKLKANIDIFFSQTDTTMTVVKGTKKMRYRAAATQERQTVDESASSPCD